MSESKTPRTEALTTAHLKENQDGCCDLYRAVRQVKEVIDHARQLEAELSAVTAEREALREDAERWRHGVKNGFPKFSASCSTSGLGTWSYTIRGVTFNFDSANAAIDAERKP